MENTTIVRKIRKRGMKRENERERDSEKKESERERKKEKQTDRKEESIDIRRTVLTHCFVVISESFVVPLFPECHLNTVFLKNEKIEFI